MNELFLQPKKIITILFLFLLIGVVNASVDPNFVSSSTYSATNPVSITFTDISTCTPACTHWAWDLDGDGVIDSLSQNIAFTYTHPGTYSPKLTVSNDVDTDTKIRFNYITIGPAFVPPTAAPHTTWGSSYSSTGTAFSYRMDTRVDLQNSTFLKYWLQNFTSSGQFSIYGFSIGIMAPIMAVFGFWIFLIIWALYLFAVWVRTGDVTLPLIIGVLTIGIFGTLFPKEALPMIIIMFVVCGAIIVTKLLKDQI